MAHSGAPPAVYPIHPVQALHDAYPAPLYPPQMTKAARASNDQQSLCLGILRIVMRMDSALRQRIFKFQLKGGWPAHPSNLGQQADITQTVGIVLDHA
jgi:hypothetical protein